MDQQTYLSGLYLLTGFSIFYFGSRSLAEGIQLLTSRAVKSFVLNKESNYALIDFLNGAKLTLISFSPVMSSMVNLGLSNAKLLKDGRALNMFSGVTFGVFLISTVLAYYSLELAYLLMSLGFLMRTFIPGKLFRNAGKLSLGLGLVYLAMSFIEKAFLDVHAESVLHNLITFSLEHSILTAILSYFIIGLCLSVIFLRANLVIALAVAISHYTSIVDFQVASLVSGGILGVFLLTFMASKKEASHRSLSEIKVIIFSIVLTKIIISTLIIIFPEISMSSIKGTSFLLAYIFSFSLLSLFIQLLSKKFLLNFYKKVDDDEYNYEQSRLKYLGEGRMLSPSMAFVMVEMEIVKLMDIVDRMFLRCHEYIESDEKRARSLAKIKDYERIIDNIQFEIDVFVEKAISTGIGEEDASTSIKYLKLASSLEKIADSLDKLATILTRFYEKWELSETEINKIILFYDEIYSLYKKSYKIFISETEPDEDIEDTLERMISLKMTLLNEREDFARAHPEDPNLMNIYYSDMMIALATTRGHARDIYKRCHE